MAAPWMRYGGRSRLAVHRALVSSRLGIVPASVDLLSGPLVDVGANVGDWTAAALAIAPTARVISVEPVANLLSERFGGDRRVRIVEAAASNCDGTATLHIAEHPHNTSLLRPLNMNTEYGSGWRAVGTRTVPVVTLDALLAHEVPSVVKIDVQGAEAAVLEGARGVLSRARAVLIEVVTRAHYENDSLFPKLHEMLSEVGYRMAGLSPPDVRATGEALWLDACYVNASQKVM